MINNFTFIWESKMDYVLLAFAATPVVGFLWSLKTTWVCDEKGVNMNE